MVNRSVLAIISMTNNQFSVNGRQCYNRYIKNQLQICTIIATGEKIVEVLFNSRF